MNIATNPISTLAHGVAIIAAFVGILAIASTFSDDVDGLEEYRAERAITMSGVVPLAGTRN